MNEHVPECVECRVHGLNYEDETRQQEDFRRARGRQDLWGPAPSLISFKSDNKFLRLNDLLPVQRQRN